MYLPQTLGKTNNFSPIWSDRDRAGLVPAPTSGETGTGLFFGFLDVF
ncbi:MAG: hypothetical protein F6K28_47975 [Microcoleus sp. SIO2G3]|nr:hypothetical protein [Microcoleus sp. SIO2G3]